VTTRLGVTLPSFRDNPDAAMNIATTADRAGLDGVFVYDHLFRTSANGTRRPALEAMALLGAVAAETTRISVGTLVARATLRPPAVLATGFDTLARIAPGRVIAALGSGDHESRDEMERFGLPFGSVAERVEALGETVAACSGRGYPVWVGGTSRAVRSLAGSSADGWNRWGGSPARFVADASLVRAAAAAAGRDPDTLVMSWGGLVVIGADDDAAAAKAARLVVSGDTIVGGPERVAEAIGVYAEAGAAWVVLGPVDAGDLENAVLLGEAVAPLLR